MLESTLANSSERPSRSAFGENFRDHLRNLRNDHEQIHHDVREHGSINRLLSHADSGQAGVPGINGILIGRFRDLAFHAREDFSRFLAIHPFGDVQ